MAVAMVRWLLLSKIYLCCGMGDHVACFHRRYFACFLSMGEGEDSEKMIGCAKQQTTNNKQQTFQKLAFFNKCAILSNG